MRRCGTNKPTIALNLGLAFVAKPLIFHPWDIHLHRARLFHAVSPYPWAGDDMEKRGPKDDLAEARRLIEKHGYWRRKEELEDAETALKVP